jgi:hypothetical protein
MRKFFDRLKQRRINTQSNNFYYQGKEYGEDKTKQFFLNLEGFGITEEVYQKHGQKLFYIMNHTFKRFDEYMDEETKNFIALINGITSGNAGNLDNFAKLFEFEIINILWNSEGTPEFRGFASSDDMRDLVTELAHQPAQVKQFKLSSKFYTHADKMKLKHHLDDLSQEYDIPFKICPPM